MSMPKIPHINTVSIKTKEDLSGFPHNLLDHGAGKCPIILEIHHLDKEKIFRLLEILSDFLESIDVHPRWPYPIYIQTSAIDIHPLFEIIENSADTANHFQISYDKKLMTKELQLLQKIHLINQQLRNLFPYEKDLEIRATLASNKKIIRETKRLDFYNYIRSKMNLTGHNL